MHPGYLKPGKTIPCYAANGYVTKGSYPTFYSATAQGDMTPSMVLLSLGLVMQPLNCRGHMGAGGLSAPILSTLLMLTCSSNPSFPKPSCPTPVYP